MFKDNKSQYKKQKSPQQRFLFVFGIVFFLMYLALGLIIIFWKTIPLNISYNGRLAFGLLLIVYAFIRFIRLLKKNKE
ncbi:hypothetical protein DVK85_08500 [Flavobacterium arcticum]|uniref:Uncharacterized protein n=1 Tax=Flavobacterium arcticum TaxID=1784713 RepID=A0A345HCG1_9FLAO|nr:hypothetical protein DVK85_08500 [Flavobacterium arcticum]